MKNIWKIVRDKFKKKPEPSHLIRLDERIIVATLLEKHKEHLIFSFDFEGRKKHFAFRVGEVPRELEVGEQVLIRVTPEKWSDSNKIFGFEIHLVEGE